MKFQLVLVAVCASALAVEGRYFTRSNHIESGQIVDYYTCTAQGNYPDPKTCDHYIACTAANIAYQMPCQTGHDGKRLFYVKDSGPDETQSYCDYPENVDCSIDDDSSESSESSEEPTEKPTDAPTHAPTHAPTEPTEAPEEPTEAPEEPTEAPTEDTPTEPPSGNNNGTCPEGLKDGDSCNPMVDCNQCGWCDFYYFCEASSETEGKWRRSQCSVRGDADKEVIRTEDKMFFHRGATVYGGTCLPGVPSHDEEEYITDPNCKNPCEFRADPDCARAYWYSDPDYTKGIWSDPGTQLLCPEGTKWDQSVLTCVFCGDGDHCDCGGDDGAKH